MKVAALCVDRLSVYKWMPDVEAYDLERDARTFEGGMPVVCHPPCAQWSRLRAFAKDNPAERDLADFCLGVVRREGGVLEHPYSSEFFRSRGLEKCKLGRTLVVDQSWFGFRARKRTWLYVVGCELRSLPVMPLALGWRRGVEDMWSGVRSRCTWEFAAWLVAIAKLTKGRVHVPQQVC